VSAEGWFKDPYGRYEARWISDGAPTALVRNGGDESRDPPPDQPFTGTLQPLDEGTGRSDDLRRADDGGRSSGYDANQAARRAWDVAIDESSGQL
jgi:hypothetical protein